MRDILVTLRNEHDLLVSLYRQLTSTSDGQDEERQMLLQRIEDILIPHAKWEELVFYPAFGERANDEECKLRSVAIQEHRVVEQSVLPDLHASDFDGHQFAGSAQVLKELSSNHIQREEREMFTAARRMFSAQELSDLDVQYEEWKDSGLATAIGLHAKVKTAASAIFRVPRAPG